QGPAQVRRVGAGAGRGGVAGAGEHLEVHGEHGQGGGVLVQPVGWDVGLFVHVVLLDVRQDPGDPAPVRGAHAAAPGAVGAGRVGQAKLVAVAGQGAQRVVVVVAGQGELLEVVGTTHAGGGLAHLLHRRQQQPDEDGNDGDDDQELDQREPPTK